MDASSSSLDSGTRVSMQIVVAPNIAETPVYVLILMPQWKFDRYGTSGITRSLIKNLRRIDPEGKVIKVTVAVLEEEGHIERNEEAEELKVHLKGYIHPKGRRKKADVQWLNEVVMTYYHHLVSEAKYDFIIGHAPYFSNGCINLRDSCRGNGLNPKVILFAHELPQNEDGETEEVILRECLSETDVVVSLTTAMREEIERQMKEIKKEDVPLPKNYIPGYPVELFHLGRKGARKSESEREIMMFTSVKNNETMGLNFTLAVNSLAITCQGPGRTTLTMLTENKSDQEEWEEEYSRVLKNANQHLTFKCQPIESAEGLRNHIRKSDLFLFPLQESSPLFCEEAFSIIASGVPVLVSSHSGVGSFLLEMDENDSVVDEVDEKSWAKRIIQKIKDPATSQEKAEHLRERLLLDTQIASTHLDLTKLISGAFILSK